MRKLGGVLALCGILLLSGAGCVFNNTKNNAATNTMPTVTTTKKDFYVNKGAGDNLSVPFSEWQKFYQKKYGWEFSYPEGWQIRTEKTENQLLVFLSNVVCESQCPPEFVGLKMKVGAIYPGNNFINYIKADIAENNENKIYPGGKVQSTTISGRTAVKVEYSDWSGAEPGPGYYVGLDRDYYAYVSTGRNNLTKNAEKVISQIIGSIKIHGNYIPRPEEVNNTSTSGDTGNESDTGDSNYNTNTYTSARYGFTLDYPEDCYFYNMTDEMWSPINLALALCGKQFSDRTVGFRIYGKGINDTWSDIFRGRSANYQVQNMLVSDRSARMYMVKSSSQNKEERWLLIEKSGATYVIYTTDYSGDYKNDFNRIITGFEFK